MRGRAHRGRDAAQVALLGDSPAAEQRHHRARREDMERGTQRRRLRPGVVRQGADRRLHLPHRRRLHRHQERTQRGRQEMEHPQPEHHRAQLRDAGRPRRCGDRLGNIGRMPQRVRGELQDGLAQPGPRAAHQEQLVPWRRDREHLHAESGGGRMP